MADPQDPPVVHVEVAAGIATITLDSPGNRNALSRQLLADLHAALERATEPDVRAIVLSHTGSVFCAGADLKERSSGPPDSGPMVDALRRLMTCPQPTIAAVKGPVRAGGIGLMASCDLIVVQPTASFAFTEVRIGVAPAIIAVPILRRVSASRLAAPFLTGSPFDAATALDMGLVTHVADDVDATVADICLGLRMGAPSAVAATKALLRIVPDLDLDDGFVQMRELSERLFSSPDAAEGMAAFFEKRTPTWHEGG